MALTTRMWLSAGVFCFGLSIIIGYHQDQVAANNVLAEKVAIPAPVPIQEFDFARHANLLHEVQLVGEASLEETTTINLGTEVAPNWVQMTPIYPVGETSLPFYAKFAAQPRRPMPRDMAPELARRADAIRPLEREAMGLILVESDVSITEAVLHRSIGEGLNGPLVIATGSLVSGDQLQQMVTDAFSGDIMREVPVVAPYLNGKRGVAVEPVRYDTLRSALEWAAVVLILIGIGNAFSVLERFAKRKQAPETDSFDHVQAVGSFPGVFQAIRTQEDLIREEQEESEKAAATTRRTFSRIHYSS